MLGTRTVSALALAAFLLPIGAIASPPSDALPLSRIVAALEASGEVERFREIEWDNAGFWEVEYFRPDGARVELRLDPLVLPATAEPGGEGRLPLSQILAQLEASGDVAWFDEIEWDSDGYWEIEFVRPNGAEVEVNIDATTGERRP